MNKKIKVLKTTFSQQHARLFLAFLQFVRLVLIIMSYCVTRFSDETNSDDTDKKEKPQEKTKEARVVKAEQQKLTHDKGSKGQDRAERQRHENEDDSDSDWGLALNDDSSENDDDESTDEDREKAKRFVPVGAPNHATRWFQNMHI